MLLHPPRRIYTIQEVEEVDKTKHHHRVAAAAVLQPSTSHSQCHRISRFLLHVLREGRIVYIITSAACCGIYCAVPPTVKARPALSEEGGQNI
jgi:hypothetical protein